MFRIFLIFDLTGFYFIRWYRSMIDPHSDTQYTCEILDGGEEPIVSL